MASYNTPYPAPAPTLYDPTRSASLGNNTPSRSGSYLRSQMKSSSPPLTSSARVSKAMKGKRVHACEHPGCFKVFTRAEHRRRHELSHEPKKQYTCTYEGCGKAFHRADYLNQHLSRHAPSTPKAKKPHAHSETKTRRSSQPQPQQHQQPLQLQQPQPPQLAMHPTTPTPTSVPIAQDPSCTRAWGSMDSFISCSQCSRGPSQSPVSVDEYPSPYSYTGETCSSPLPNDTFTNPQYPSSGMPVEMVTVIDQYLRSILKPEAFSVPEQQMDPTIWSPDLEIDPTLMKMEPQQDQLPLYSWPPAESLQYEGHATQMNQPHLDSR
ncbi:unnamed protein product [Penicillium salamii]|nr:unnamed protein product [Penicillium salamii]